jgi:hypothetical protein
MPGTRPGMTISFEFNNLRHGRACPGHPRPARILLIGWHSAFIRILLGAALDSHYRYTFPLRILS